MDEISVTLGWAKDKHENYMWNSISTKPRNINGQSNHSQKKTRLTAEGMDRQKANRERLAGVIKMFCICFVQWLYEYMGLSKNHQTEHNSCVFYCTQITSQQRHVVLKLTCQSNVLEFGGRGGGEEYTLDRINHLIFKFSITTEK